MTITVQAANGNRVALWERHPDHPGGEIFLKGGTVADAAETPAVRAAISAGRLVVLSSSSPSPADEGAVPLPAPSDPSPPVTSVDGIGPATARELAALGIETVADLVAHEDLTGRLGTLQEAARHGAD